MKTKIKLLTLLLFVSVFVSCEDATDIEQKGTLTPETTFETVSDLQTGLNGVYAQYTTLNAINFNAIFSDDAKNGASSNGQNQSLYNLVLNPTTGEAGSIWANRYATINFANRVLEAYNNLEFDNAQDQADADIIAGQLYGLRALSTLDLYQYFSESYTNDDALSIPIMKKVPENTSIQPTRDKVGDVVQFINDDLDKGEQLLENEAFNSIYLSKDALEAMRARLQLFHGDYDEAAVTADNVLQDRGGLTNASNYKQIFTDENDDGVIWKKKLSSSDEQVVALFYFNWANLNGDPFVEVSNGLFNSFLDEANTQDPSQVSDVRFETTIRALEGNPNSPVDDGSLYFGKDNPDNVLLINKYPGTSTSNKLVNDLLVIRTAEMLLIKAEALARKSSPDVSGAESAINDLLQARNSSATANFGGDVHTALKEILKQRRFELAFEGHRYLDLKRFRDVTNEGINRDDADCSSYFADGNCSLSKDDYRWILPIPQAELNGNGEIQQNPGY